MPDTGLACAALIWKTERPARTDTRIVVRLIVDSRLMLEIGRFLSGRIKTIAPALYRARGAKIVHAINLRMGAGRVLAPKKGGGGEGANDPWVAY